MVCGDCSGGVLVDCERIVEYHGGYMEQKSRLIANLKRVRGQVGGIIKMIEDNKGCEATLTQISAAISSLKGVGKNLLVDEAGKCGSSGKSRENYAKLLKRYL